MATDFLVHRDDLHATRFADAPSLAEVELRDGEALVAVDRFGFSANNITYAAMGERMRYWDFFPAPPGFGRVPVWGFGTVVRSTVAGVPVGLRLYGYYPMSSYLVVRPADVRPSGFTDAAKHRRDLHALYNRYTATGADPNYDETTENEQMLMRPLFITAFALDAFFADAGYFGAATVAITSASSKLAVGIACLFAARKRAGETVPERLALTSPARVPFVASLGLYDRIAAYPDIATLPNDDAVAYIDMAGGMTVRRALHERFGERLVYACAVGGTHWNDAGGSGNLSGAKPQLFFAPAQIATMMTAWGPRVFAERLSGAWNAYLAALRAADPPWLRIETASGTDAIERVYQATLDGTARADAGFILSFE